MFDTHCLLKYKYSSIVRMYKFGKKVVDADNVIIMDQKTIETCVVLVKHIEQSRALDEYGGR